MTEFSFAEGVRLLISAGQTPVLRPTGSSMVPAIYPGDGVVVRAVDGPIRVGDIALTDGPPPRLHRVIGVDAENETIVTKGDALAGPDSSVSQASVAAIVERIEPSWGARARFLLARRFPRSWRYARRLLGPMWRGLTSRTGPGR
jgi:hypothetical protein